MANVINPPRGMRDFLPGQKARRDALLDTILGVYRQHGFSRIETPVMENLDRLTSGQGGDNEKLAFRVMRRGLSADQIREAAASQNELDLADLGLRFDLTVPLSRFYATHHAELPAVFRSIQAAPVWRAERPQRGRYRQFVQCDIDIIGEASALAECELMTATGAALRAIGLQGFSFRVNDRRILEAMLAWCGFPAAETGSVLVSVDKLDKIGVDGVLAELRANGHDQAVDRLGVFLERVAAAGDAPLSREGLAPLLEGIGADEAVESLLAIADAVGATGDAPQLIFDPTLVRGMGYYTGTIFEIHHPDFGSSVGGGGRYDHMVGRFLGTQVPACGFSIGFERILELLGSDQRARDGVVLIYDAEVPLARLLQLKTALVAQGRRVELQRAAKRLGRQLDAAAAAGWAEHARVHVDSTIGNLDIRALS